MTPSPLHGEHGSSAGVTEPATDAGTSLDLLPCGVLTIGDDGRIRAANRPMHELVGKTGGELVGRPLDDILTVGSRIFYQTHLFPLLRMHRHAEEIFLLLRGRDGAEEGVLVNAVRATRNGEEVSDWVVMRVRERQRFEDALVRARKVAEAAQAAEAQQRRELAIANEMLEQQAVELEMGQQQLEEQAEELAVQSAELQRLNDELVEHAEEVQRQREVADEANRAKSAFLAAMSHELRTPLNAIGGYVQLLQMQIHGDITPAQDDALAKVMRSQRHLLRLINEVLNLARIEAGSVNYDIHPVPLADVVDAVLPMIEPQLTERGLHRELQLTPGLVALADRPKAEQVLLNLLSNAAKFTPAGGRVRVLSGTEPGRTRRVWLEVQDTGVGIPPEKLAQVFDPFVQVDTSPSGRAEGTGLGLSISRDLARGMSGSLTATSEPGVGSTFRLTLPAGTPARLPTSP